MAPEARLESTDTGPVQAGPGWFVVNAREARWRYAEGRGAVCPFGDDTEFAQVGVNLYVLAKDEAMGMYHWESNQEDFLVLSGSGMLLVESMIEIVRRTQRNVKRWSSGEMALRWTAAGMLEAERQFRKIIGYRNLATLVVAIERDRDRRRATHELVRPQAC